MGKHCCCDHWYLQLVCLVPPPNVSVQVLPQDGQEAPDVCLQVFLGYLLQWDEDGDRVALNLHLWLDEEVHVIGIQVGAFISSADAETHSLLGQLPTDPLGAEREVLLSTNRNLSPQGSFAGTVQAAGAVCSQHGGLRRSLGGLRTCKSSGT